MSWAYREAEEHLRLFIGMRRRTRTNVGQPEHYDLDGHHGPGEEDIPGASRLDRNV